MGQISRAISIRQPYVEQILRGKKKIEYGSRPTNVRERVYVYAGLRLGEADDWEAMGLVPAELPVGLIVGSVEIVGCRLDAEFRMYEWLLACPKGVASNFGPAISRNPRYGVRSSSSATTTPRGFTRR
jgi:hypothetical protein